MFMVESARENVSTRIVFETPTLTPRTLLRIRRAFLFHSLY
jgi:hypothetical protein